ncbi:MAG: SRPBCC domain-containing protein [Dehalococcoidia bacterium]
MAEARRSAMQQELVIERVFDAPRDLVWKAWTDPELIKQWHAPKGFTAPFCENDLRVGGKYLNCMRGPAGSEFDRDFWSTGVYREIVPMERIVCTDSFADENGNVVPASHYGMEGDVPLEMLVTVTFEEQDGKTKLTLRHAGMPAGEHRDGAGQGWSEFLDKLAAVLAAA